MRNKIELQNLLIESIEDWLKRGKPLGLSNAQNLVDVYEQEVAKLNSPDNKKSMSPVKAGDQVKVKIRSVLGNNNRHPLDTVNIFECPVCLNKEAEVDPPGNLFIVGISHFVYRIMCQECFSVFDWVSGYWYEDTILEVVAVSLRKIKTSRNENINTSVVKFPDELFNLGLTDNQLGEIGLAIGYIGEEYNKSNFVLKGIRIMLQQRNNDTNKYLWVERENRIISSVLVITPKKGQ